MPSKHKNKRQPGNPAMRAAQGVSSVSDWKRESTATIVALPSGKRCLANRIGMMSFLQQGTVPDYLTPVIEKVIREKKYLPPEEEQDIANDPVAALKAQEMMDRALVLTVVEPPVHMPPGCEDCGQYLDYNDDGAHNRNGKNFTHDFIQEEREEDLLYTDEVDLMDKVFLFQWSVGGGADLKEFRKSWTESMERVASLQVNGSTA